MLKMVWKKNTVRSAALCVCENMTTFRDTASLCNISAGVLVWFTNGGTFHSLKDSHPKQGYKETGIWHVLEVVDSVVRTGHHLKAEQVLSMLQSHPFFPELIIYLAFVVAALFIIILTVSNRGCRLEGGLCDSWHNCCPRWFCLGRKPPSPCTRMGSRLPGVFGWEQGTPRGWGLCLECRAVVP